MSVLNKISNDEKNNLIKVMKEKITFAKRVTDDFYGLTEISNFMRRDAINIIDEIIFKKQREYLCEMRKIRRINHIACMQEIFISDLRHDLNLPHEEDEEDEEDEEQPQHINASETCESDTCVLCLDKNTHPNILFCSCGHICLCNSCNNFYNKKDCPVCRVESGIIRKI